MTAQSKDLDEYFSKIDAKSIRALVSAAADLVLIVGREGCVKGVMGDRVDNLGFEVTDLVGQKVQSLAPMDDEQTIKDLLETADDVPNKITLMHTTPNGPPIEINYNVLSLGSEKDVIFLGQNQRKFAVLKERLKAAELNSHRQNARKKQDAAEFRALFSINQHPIVIVSAKSGIVKDANNSALNMLGFDRAQLLGQRLKHIFAKPNEKAIDSVLDQVKTSEAEVKATLTNSNVSVLVKPLKGIVGRDALIVRLIPDANPAKVENLDQAVLEMAKEASDYLAVVDKTGKTLWSNDQWLTHTNQDAVLSANLQNYLSCDLVDLLTQTHEMGRVSVATQVRSATGALNSAELSLVYLKNTHQDLFGLTATLDPDSEESQSLTKPWSTQKVGRVPLPALVREEVDLIEKNCIEAALKLTGNNRQATAKVLGISRQGLYDKLRRHKLLTN